jgi:hypothetical protein
MNELRSRNILILIYQYYEKNIISQTKKYTVQIYSINQPRASPEHNRMTIPYRNKIPFLI